MGGCLEQCGTGGAGGRESHRPPPLRTVNRLLYAYLFLVLWNSLIPFQLDLESLRSLRGDFVLGLPAVEQNYGDAVSNIAAYVPLGALLALSLWFKSGKLLASMLGSVVLCNGMSFGVEFLQQYEAARISSINDLLCNGAGAAVGGGCAPMMFVMVRQVRKRWTRELHVSPLASLVRLYAGGLLLVALIPWSFTVDQKQVLENHRAAKVSMARVAGSLVPWAEYADYAAYQGAAERRREAMETVMTGIYELLTFAILAALVSRILDSDLGFRRGSRILLTFYLVGGFATAMAALQLFIRFGTGNYLMYWARLLGCSLGVLAYWRVPAEWTGRNLLRHWSRNGVRLTSRLRFPLVPCAFFIVFFMGWVPFFFSMAGARPMAVNVPVLLPFYQYFHGRTPIVYQDFFFKLLRFGTLGFTLSLAAGPWVGDKRFLRMLKAGCWCALAAGIIEVFQVFIPTRYPDLTDVIMGFGGGVLGVAWHARLEGYLGSRGVSWAVSDAARSGAVQTQDGPADIDSVSVAPE